MYSSSQDDLRMHKQNITQVSDLSVREGARGRSIKRQGSRNQSSFKSFGNLSNHSLICGGTITHTAPASTAVLSVLNQTLITATDSCHHGNFFCSSLSQPCPRNKLEENERHTLPQQSQNEEFKRRP